MCDRCVWRGWDGLIIHTERLTQSHGERRAGGLTLRFRVTWRGRRLEEGLLRG